MCRKTTRARLREAQLLRQADALYLAGGAFRDLRQDQDLARHLEIRQARRDELTQSHRSSQWPATSLDPSPIPQLPQGPIRLRQPYKPTSASGTSKCPVSGRGHSRTLSEEQSNIVPTMAERPLTNLTRSYRSPE